MNDEWTLVTATARKGKSQVKEFRSASEIGVKEYLKIAQLISHDDEQKVLQMWQEQRLCFKPFEHAWIIPFFLQQQSACMRLNHIAGKGCAGTCKYNHTCLLCGSSSHGMFMKAPHPAYKFVCHVCPVYQQLSRAVAHIEVEDEKKNFNQIMCDLFFNRFA